MENRLDQALALAARGFRVFPIAAGAKKPPLLNDWPRRASIDPDKIRQFWAAVPDANIGIHCEGLLVVDVDVKKGGLESWKALRDLLDLPRTLTHETPTGGFHAIYRLPEGHPGVSNSVGQLGKGLDVRSTGGYIVAPGSETVAGAYSVASPLDIAPAPAALVGRLGRVEPKTPPAQVADAPADVVARAVAWLAGHPGAVEGQGGDAHTYATACRLRDLGLSAGQALEALQGWNDRCSPPWAPADLEIKVRNAYSYAQNEEGGVRMQATADMFQAAAQTVGAEAPPPAKRTRAQRADEFTAGARARQRYLIKNLLNRGSYALMYGAPGAGKTFVALDIAHHVAAGRPWMGLKVKAGLVLYLAFEGMGGLRKRVQALQARYGDLGELYIADAGMNLRETAGRQELAAVLAELPEPPALVVVDTLARALCGGDENSAQDTGALIDALSKLIESTGACVLTVHHSGKDVSRGARGSSAIKGALDTEIAIENDFIQTSKQRDMEMIPALPFKLEPAVVGTDEDGEDETSCTVSARQADLGPYRRELKGKAVLAWQIVEQLTGEANVLVTRSKLVETCIEQGIGKSRANEIIHGLLKDGRLMAENGLLRRGLK